MKLAFTLHEFESLNELLFKIFRELGIDVKELDRVRGFTLRRIAEMHPILSCEVIADVEYLVLNVPEELVLEVTRTCSRHADIIVPIVSSMISLANAFKFAFKAMSREMKSVDFKKYYPQLFKTDSVEK